MGYWIRDWIDAEGIDTVEQAEKLLLQDGRSLNLLFSLCEQQARAEIPVVPAAEQQLVAGLGMDLSGRFECLMSDCVKKRVDEVLYRAWHYFDKVVVNGLDSREMMQNFIGKSRVELPPSVLLPHIEIALYVREVGADDSLIFLDRPAFCQEHLDQHAREAGLVGNFEQAAESLADHLFKGHRFELFKERDGGLAYTFTHPDLNAAHVGMLTKRPFISREALARQLASDIGRSLAGTTILNTALAKFQSAALGRSTAGEFPDLAQSRGAPVPEDVAFNLNLPVLESVPIKEVLEFRRHEAADFQAFRLALRTAIEERIRALPGADAEKVANSVYEDVLEPTLVNLDRKAGRAAELLAKRSAASATVGAVMATVGLLAFAPIVAPGVVIGASGLLASYHEWLKDRRDVQLSDLHFLWRLTNDVAGRHL